MRKFTVLLVALVISACSEGVQEDMSAAEKSIQHFAEAYFNYDFQEAYELITPESRPWLRFAASNITQEDLDELNNRESYATIELSETSVINDTTIEARISVENYYKADSIGQPVRATDKVECYMLTAVKRGKQWLVRMEDLPKSEKHSHD